MIPLILPVETPGDKACAAEPFEAGPGVAQEAYFERDVYQNVYFCNLFIFCYLWLQNKTPGAALFVRFVDPWREVLQPLATNWYPRAFKWCHNGAMRCPKWNTMLPDAFKMVHICCKTGTRSYQHGSKCSRWEAFL